MSDDFDEEYDDLDLDDDAFDEDEDVDTEEDDDPSPDIDAGDDHAGHVQPHFGTSWTVPGSTESGNAVEWSTSTNAYHDQKTWEEVEPK